MKMNKDDKLRSLKPGDLIEVLWGDACLYERVTDKMLRNLKPEHLDTPMRNVGRFMGVMKGRLMSYLVLWIGQDNRGHRLAVIPTSLIIEVKKTRRRVEKKPMISHRFYRLHGVAVKIYGVKKIGEED